MATKPNQIPFVFNTSNAFPFCYCRCSCCELDFQSLPVPYLPACLLLFFFVLFVFFVLLCVSWVVDSCFCFVGFLSPRPSGCDSHEEADANVEGRSKVIGDLNRGATKIGGLMRIDPS